MASFGNISLGTNPFVGISDEIVLWGGKHCAIKRVVIGGKIYECGDGPNTGNQILDAIAGWQNAALNGYQSISAGGFSANYARCESIEVTNSDYLGAEYRAEFLAYPDDWFSGTVGILEPVDNISASIGKDGLLTVKRNASARAASKKGFGAVQSWLSSLNLETPPDISKFGFPKLSSLSPKTLLQTTDRVNGSISAEVTFVQNEGSTTDTILVYNIDIQYDDRAGIYSVTVSGSIEGNIRTNISTVRSQIGEIGAFQLANDAFGKMGAEATLDPDPADLNFSENDETDTVNFSFTYNTFPAGGQKRYFNFTTDYDHVRDIVTVTISGTVTFDSKISMKLRDEVIDGIIEQYDFASLCEEEFSKNSPSQTNKLNLNNPVSYSITINRGADITADVSVSYNNEDVMPGGDNDYISFDYDIEVNPSVDVFIPIQFTNGSGGAFDFQAKNRGSASIKGTAVTKQTGMDGQIINEALDLLDSAMNDFSPEDELLLEKNITYGDTSDNGIVYEFEIKKGAILNF
jgi:hypothetical protein